jgi:hypothetical protein
MCKSSCRSLRQLEEEERNTTPFQDTPHFLHTAHTTIAAQRMVFEKDQSHLRQV